MHTSKILTSAFVIILTFHSVSMPQGNNNLDFFPMEIGNKWQYQRVETYMDSVLSISYFTVESLFDTLMPNGKEYRSFGGIRYFRIDSTNLLVYRYRTWCDSMEIAIYDLSQPSSNIGEPYNWTDECFGFSCCQSEYEYDQVGMMDLDTLIYKRYAGYGEHYNFLSLGIGKCYREEGDVGYSREEFLVAAEINGVTYGDFVGTQDELTIFDYSIAQNDTVSNKSELIIQFSEPIDTSSFQAEQIVPFVLFVPDEDPVILDSTRFMVYDAANITLNDEPQTFFYDSNTGICAFIRETTALLPDGTGTGFYPDDENVLNISNLITDSDIPMYEEFQLTFSTTESEWSTIMYPNPSFLFNPENPSPSTNNVSFYHLPATCTIRIYDLLDSLIYTIERVDEWEGGHERWYLIENNEVIVPYGIYQWTIENDSLGAFEHGVFCWAGNENEFVDINNEITIPTLFNLFPAYPNPFNPVTTIRYELPERTDIRLAIYDLRGREVTVLANGVQGPGIREVRWDAANAASGIYFYRLQTGDQTITKKLVVLK